MCSANGALVLAASQTLLDAGFTKAMTALRIYIRICASMKTDRTNKFIFHEITKNLESKIPLSRI
jgi:hypothetical protein